MWQSSLGLDLEVNGHELRRFHIWAIEGRMGVAAA
jgi:hypothetical protein